MKHQLCRNCGHRHRLGDPCIFRGDEKSGPEESPLSTDAAPVVSSGRDSPARSNASSAGSRGSAAAKKPPIPNVQSVGTSTSGGLTTSKQIRSVDDTQSVAVVLRETFFPLTSAEKQKAYRERHKERVREANRLRMAAKRKEDGGG